MNFSHINVDECTKMLQKETVAVVDIRDAMSFAKGHIQGAIHLDSTSLRHVVSLYPKDRPLVVCCYHGVSSQHAARYFIEQGFHHVYNLDGGYEAWESFITMALPEGGS